MENTLPPIPAKRYFTIGEVADLCGVKPHVLRYWEQEFTQLRPMKRRGNRRYYQHHEVLMIRRIRELLYEKGFSISGAKVKLQELTQLDRDRARAGAVLHEQASALENSNGFMSSGFGEEALLACSWTSAQLQQLERELWEIRELLTISSAS
ncbi:MAG: MerR family transcriptional regulator [Pseudomonadota bacterium]|nr:MerR family transcriptional regulator [Pseudomonadota bacterium]